MFQAMLPALVLLLQVTFGPSPPPTAEQLGLPRQYDLDLPVQVETYDPARRPPGPLPDGGEDDPRDEPAPVFYGEEIASENDTICYVIDISGSMRREERIERARRELRTSIMALSSNVRFNIVAFSCTIRKWQPQLQLATPSKKSEALAWVEALVVFGSTGTGPAVAVALSDRECMAVVLLTDGAPNCGAATIEEHRRMIRAANLQGATINVFGVEASGEYRAFCMHVAADSGGSYYDVP